MKRKTTNLVIVLLSFLIAALIALAVFMTWFTKEQTAFLEKSLRDVKNEHSVQDSSDTADTSDHIVSSSCHHFLLSEIPERSAWRKPCRIPMMRIPALI